MCKIKLALADDHAILIEATASILKEYDFIELVGSASDGEQTLELIESKNPNILVSDITMPGMSVFDISEAISKKSYPTKILIFTMHNSANYIYQALNSKISGYITKNSGKEELLKAIQTIAKGDEYYSQEISQIIVKGFKNRHQTNPQNPLDLLSKREREVISLVAEGLSSKQIADKLFLSERTVSNHRANMMQKCKVGNSVELVMLYMDNAQKW